MYKRQLYSPVVGSIKIIRSGKVKRAKLYNLRHTRGKSARIAEKIKKNIGIDVEVKTPTAEITEDNIKEKEEGAKKDLIKQEEKKITKKEEVKKSDNLK